MIDQASLEDLVQVRRLQPDEGAQQAQGLAPMLLDLEQRVYGRQKILTGATVSGREAGMRSSGPTLGFFLPNSTSTDSR